MYYGEQVSLRRYTFVGTLARDPEIIVSKNGTVFGRAYILINERHKTKTNTYRNRSYHFVVTLFADYLLQHLNKYKKGDFVYTEGSIVNTKRIHQNGSVSYITNFVAERFGGAIQDREPRQIMSIDNAERLRAIKEQEEKQKTENKIEDQIEDFFNELDV